MTPPTRCCMTLWRSRTPPSASARSWALGSRTRVRAPAARTAPPALPHARGLLAWCAMQLCSRAVRAAPSCHGWSGPPPGARVRLRQAARVHTLAASSLCFPRSSPSFVGHRAAGNAHCTAASCQGPPPGMHMGRAAELLSAAPDGGARVCADKRFHFEGRTAPRLAVPAALWRAAARAETGCGAAVSAVARRRQARGRRRSRSC